MCTSSTNFLAQCIQPKWEAALAVNRKKGHLWMFLLLGPSSCRPSKHSIVRMRCWVIGSTCIPASPIGTVCTSLKACNRRVQSDPKYWSTVWQLVDVLSTKFFVAPSCVQDVKQTPNGWGGKVRQDDVTPVSHSGMVTNKIFLLSVLSEVLQFMPNLCREIQMIRISESLKSGFLSQWTRTI